ncbi:MAG: haloacid dehalogenase [Leuconostoc mesenteroides]
MKDKLYQYAQEFHQSFDNREPNKPQPLTQSELINRVGFILEELTELAVSQCHNQTDVEQVFLEIKQRLDAAKTKLGQKPINRNSAIVQQADSLGDIIYLSYGSFVLMGVEPSEILESIHNANMHKLFPDGKPHRDKITKKVLKPAAWYTTYQPEPIINAVIDQQKES